MPFSFFLLSAAALVAPATGTCMHKQRVDNQLLHTKGRFSHLMHGWIIMPPNRSECERLVMTATDSRFDWRSEHKKEEDNDDQTAG